MKLAVDLHIHSCLSPCASEDMLPADIVAMAALKGLDAVAIADHNRALNVPAALEAGARWDVAVLPAIEVQSREEVHLLCYFEAYAPLAAFDSWLYSRLPDYPNRPDIFGEQCIIAPDGSVCAMEPRLLSQAADASIEQIAEQCIALGGVFVPAHIDRGSYSLLSNLGFIPDTLPGKLVELSGDKPCPQAEEMGLRVLRSSDAHDLGAILERAFFIDGPARSAGGVFDALRRMSTS